MLILVPDAADDAAINHISKSAQSTQTLRISAFLNDPRVNLMVSKECIALLFRAKREIKD
jgi:hypothetical protein